MTTKELSNKYDIPLHILMQVRRYYVRSASSLTLVAYERETLQDDEWHDVTTRVRTEEELSKVNKQLRRQQDGEQSIHTPLV